MKIDNFFCEYSYIGANYRCTLKKCDGCIEKNDCSVCYYYGTKKCDNCIHNEEVRKNEKTDN